jgi:hypothetical protein
VSIPAGSTSASFFYGDTKAASPTITVGSTGFTSVTRAVTINAGAAAELCVTQGSTCTGSSLSVPKGTAIALTCYLADAFGNAVTAGSAITVTVGNSGQGSVSSTALRSAPPSRPATR